MKNAQQIEVEVRRLAIPINAPDSLLRIYSHPKGDGTPHVEVHGEAYHYVSTERGYEIFRKVIGDEGELLFIIFQRIIRSMAGDFELKNRDESSDCRRIIFSKILELTRMIDCDWELKQKAEIEEILISAPYEDR